MSCYLCGSSKSKKRPGSVRDNPKIDVLECIDCGLVYLSSSSHIQDGHYEDSGMHGGEALDVNAWLKSTEFDDRRRYDFVKERIVNKSLLDFGCGAAGFLDLAKKSAHSVSGVELEKALQPSFLQRDLEVFDDLSKAKQAGKKYDLITAFHVVEHLQDPRAILRQLSQLLAGDKGEIIIEVPNSDDVLLTLYENSDFRDFTYWSQHLFLFNSKTIAELIKQSGLVVKWIKHVQRYPLSNHLYWLAKGNPGGHQQWNFLNSISLDKEYESQLASIGKTDTIMVGASK